MNFSKDGQTLTIILYVDDELALWLRACDSEWFVKVLEKRFGKITVETSNEFTYLGMLIRIDDAGNYSVDMQKYISDMNTMHFGEEKVKLSKVPVAKEVFQSTSQNC